MGDDRRKILEMLAAGKITADEAERLMAALETEQRGSGANGAGPGAKFTAKYLRIVVESAEGRTGKPTKVNVRVPMQLLRAGVKLARLVPAEARERVNSALRRDGLLLDLNQINPENLEELVERLNDLTVDVDDGKTTVRFYCEP